MKKVASVTFTSKLRREYSATPRATDLGEHTTEMVLYASKDDSGYRLIEWDMPDLELTQSYGIWTDKDVLMDYDGGFSLPEQAIKLLRDNGITVPVEFE